MKRSSSLHPRHAARAAVLRCGELGRKRVRVGALTGRRVLCATQLSTRWNSSLFKVKTGSKSTDMRQISKAVARGAQRGSARPPTLLAHLDQRRARAARLWAHMQSVMIRCAARSRRGCGAVRREDMGSRNCRVVSSLVHLSRKMVCDFWDLHRPSSRAVLARTHTHGAQDSPAPAHGVCATLPRHLCTSEP